MNLHTSQARDYHDLDTKVRSRLLSAISTLKNFSIISNQKQNKWIQTALTRWSGSKLAADQGWPQLHEPLSLLLQKQISYSGLSGHSQLPSGISGIGDAAIEPCRPFCPRSLSFAASSGEKGRLIPGRGVRHIGACGRSSKVFLITFTLSCLRSEQPSVSRNSANWEAELQIASIFLLCWQRFVLHVKQWKLLLLSSRIFNTRKTPR